MRKITKIWKCKNGEKIRICDMTDNHLNNTINFMERIAKNNRNSELKAAYSVSCMLQGDMASFCCENDIESMEEDPDGEAFLHPLYDDLIKEQHRRKYNKFLKERV